MQFLLVKENGPKEFLAWEDEFRDIEAWLQSLTPPEWPWAVDTALAEKGRAVFATHCGSCHGSAGSHTAKAVYPEKIVPIDEVGTDRVRFDSLTARDRRNLNESWFAQSDATRDSATGRESPAGYVAPPLDGIWASGPYFHNGSVPTLWHVLHSASRPAVWHRTHTGYDRDRVGLEVISLESMPVQRLTSAERRTYFDTSKPGKSAAGHDFPDALDEEEKTSVLEYLKTL